MLAMPPIVLGFLSSLLSHPYYVMKGFKLFVANVLRHISQEKINIYFHKNCQRTPPAANAYPTLTKGRSLKRLQRSIGSTPNVLLGRQ